MKKLIRILVVEDSEDDALLVLQQIRNGGYSIEYELVDTARKMKNALRKKPWNIVLSDYAMPNFNGLEALELLKKAQIDIPFIVISGIIGEEIAVGTMKAGAQDYIMKDNLQRLLPVVERELRESGKRIAQKMLEQKQKRTEDALYASEERFRSLCENAKIGLYRTTPDGTIVMANKALVTMLGYQSFDELSKRNLEQDGFETPHQRKAFLEEIEQIGEVENFKTTWIRQDRTPVFVRESARAIRDSSGKTLYYDGTVENITQRKRMEEALMISQKRLRESEARYRQLFETSADGILIADVETKTFKYANPALCRMLGYTEKELTTLSLADIHPGKDFQLILIEFESLAHGDKTLASDIPCLRKDGSIVYADINSSNITIDGRKYIVGLFRDITERKQAEESLRQSEIKLQVIIESTADGILAIDGNGKVIKTNNRFAELWKIPPAILNSGDDATLLNFVLEQLVNPKQFLDKVQKLYNSTDEDSDTLFFKDGRIFERYSAPLILDDKIIGRVWSFRDITERKQAEEALRDSEQRYRLLIETVNEGILVAQNGFLKFVNPMMQEITGYTHEELLTLPFINYLHPEDREIVISNHLKRLKGEQFLPRYQFRIVKKDGSIRRIEMNGIIIEWEGQPATLNMLTDITERKQAEEEIKLINEQLLKLNAEKDKFFSIIAHDLRGPFSGFLGLTELMAEELPRLTMDEIQEISINLRNSATNLFRLLENLLHWAKLQRGKIPFDPKVIRLLPIVDESITTLLDNAKSKGIEIAYDIPDNLEIFADSNILQTIIRNLVSNAVKFTHKGGKISVSAKASENKSIKISVKDSGIGMSREMVDNIFRLDAKTSRKGTEDEPSTGLGLLLCKEFVEKLGGEIWVESEEGKGTTFYFTLT